MMGSPALSVVIPVYNEEQGLPVLFTRLYPALDALEIPYEIIFINDGSRDRSAALLREQFHRRAEVTRVVLLAGNFGQHMAILAGFAQCRGDRIVTLDADLQNPPEEIHKLLTGMDAGHDYVGGVREVRQDVSWRRHASWAMNRLRERITHIVMTDQGCMLRAYSRDIVHAINHSHESNTFIPALAYTYARNPGEVLVKHEERAAGESKYSLYQLIRLNFDLMTGFSIIPLQVFSLVGLSLSFFSALFVIYLALRRIFIGPEVAGVFTLFGVLFFLIGVILFGIGLLGEYVGRIYQQVRQRPRYLIDAILQQQDDNEPPSLLTPDKRRPA